MNLSGIRAPPSTHSAGSVVLIDAVKSHTLSRHHTKVSQNTAWLGFVSKHFIITTSCSVRDIAGPSVHLDVCSQHDSISCMDPGQSREQVAGGAQHADLAARLVRGHHLVGQNPGPICSTDSIIGALPCNSTCLPQQQLLDTGLDRTPSCTSSCKVIWC